MKRALPFLLLALTAFAQTSKPPLTNADVIAMSRAGVPESTIILSIKNTPVKFDVSAEGRRSRAARRLVSQRAHFL
jgi:hypothetical protein